jgi:hypothetical protein
MGFAKLLRGLGCGLAVAILSYASSGGDQLDVWYPRNQEPVTWNGIAYGAGTFVAVGGNHIATSGDGRDWVFRRVDVSESISDVIFAQNRFIAVAGNRLMLSSNLTSWDVKILATTNRFSRIAHGNGVFLLMSGILVEPINARSYSTNFLWRSTNASVWTPIPFTGTGRLVGIAYGNGTFVAAAFGSTILTSPDGMTWTDRSSGIPLDLQLRFTNVEFTSGRFVASGGLTTNGIPVELWSSDGIVWQELKDPKAGGGFYVTKSVCAVEDRWIKAVWSVNSNNIVLTSSTNWSYINADCLGGLNRIIHEAGVFVAVGDWANIVHSSDGVEWHRAHPTNYLALSNLSDLDYLDHEYVAVGYDWIDGTAAILSSTNGIDWLSRVYGSNALNAVVLTPQSAVAVGNRGTILVRESNQWIAAASPTTNNLNEVIWANNVFVAVGGGTKEFAGERYTSSESVILTSYNGLNWSAQILPPQRAKYAGLRAIAYGNGTFVAVGEGTAILTSNNGFTWTRREIAYQSGKFLTGVSFGYGRFVAVGSLEVFPGSSLLGGNGLLLLSADGATWTSALIPPYIYNLAKSVCFGDSTFLTESLWSSETGAEWSWFKHAGRPGKWVSFAEHSFWLIGDSGFMAESGDLRIPIVSATRTAGAAGYELELQVSGVPGKIYVLEHTPRIDFPDWREKGTFTSTSFKTSVRQPISPEGAAYFRLRAPQ